MKKIYNYIKLFIINLTAKLLSFFVSDSIDKRLLTILNLRAVIGKCNYKKIVTTIVFYRIYQFLLARNLTLLKYFRFNIINYGTLEKALQCANGLFIPSISFSLNTELFYFLSSRGYKVTFVFNNASYLDGFNTSIQEYQKIHGEGSFTGKIVLLDETPGASIESLKKVIEAFRSNEIVISYIDNVNTQKNSTKRMNYQFLGMEMSESSGLFEIVRRLGTPVLPAVAINTSFCKTDILFHDELFFIHTLPACNAISEVYNFFTSLIRRYPEKWLNWYSIKRKYRDQLQCETQVADIIEYKSRGTKYTINIPSEIIVESLS